MDTARTKYAVWISAAAFAVFVAAFMPWGTISAKPFQTFPGIAPPVFQEMQKIESPFGNQIPFNQNPFGNMALNITVNGWNGSVTLLGLSLPNWITVLLAIAATAVAWLSLKPDLQIPSFLSLTFAILGLVQALATVAIFTWSSQSSVGIGAILTAISFAGMTAACSMLMSQSVGKS